MICESCGADISEEATSCPACGVDIRGGYIARGPSVGRFGKGVMYLDWAGRWILVMVFGFLFGVILLGMSVSADNSDAGLIRGMGLLFVLAGLLGTYVTYLNLRKRRAT